MIEKQIIMSDAYMLDWIAVAAMQGLVSSTWSEGESTENIAQISYNYAVSMMKERHKRLNSEE